MARERSPAPGRPLLVAAVSGFAAWRIALLLDKELPDRVRLLRADPRVDPRLVDELEQATAAIRRAGEEWQQWRAFVDESAKGGETKTQASSPREITPREASMLLGRTPTRVRQLLSAGRINGRRDDGGRWWTTPEAVLAFRDCPRNAA